MATQRLVTAIVVLVLSAAGCSDSGEASSGEEPAVSEVLEQACESDGALNTSELGIGDVVLVVDGDRVEGSGVFFAGEGANPVPVAMSLRERLLGEVLSELAVATNRARQSNHCGQFPPVEVVEEVNGRTAQCGRWLGSYPAMGMADRKVHVMTHARDTHFV